MNTRENKTDRLERYRAEYLKLKTVLHDRTTGLPAYPLMIDRLRTLLDRRRCLGVLHVSVSNLDTVESLYGWQVFDEILSRIARVLRQAIAEDLPEGALLAVDRVAGGQFVVFVPQGENGGEVAGPMLADAASGLRARVEQALEADDFAGLNPRLRLRAGHALLSVNPFYRFERRVYAAVEEARTHEERLEERRERSWGEELKRIIDESAVRMVFQPVLDLETGSVLGYEALARGPKDSMLEMPRAMFSLSSRVGVSADLDRLCRKAALRDSEEVTGRGELFVNVLPGNLEDPEWQNGRRADGASTNRWNLVLEVSERGADQDAQRFIAALKKLKSRGFSVALDDIGTGYASLATLEHVRPDYLKVDVSLVRDIHQHLIKQEVLASLVQIADRIGASVIAEGIESEEEASVLLAAGARFGQGYLFAAPSPAATVGRIKGRNTEH